MIAEKLTCLVSLFRGKAVRLLRLDKMKSVKLQHGSRGVCLWVSARSWQSPLSIKGG